MKAAGFCMLACLASAVAGGAEPQRDAPSPEDARSMYVRANAMLADARNGDVDRVPQLLEAAAPVYFPAAYKLLEVYEGRYKGIPEQPEKAARLARRLAEDDSAGDAVQAAMRAVAMFQLAGYLEKGRGCEADMPQAVMWMKRAADAGNEAARVELARYLMLGKGVKQDARRARETLIGVARRAPQTPKVFFYLGTLCYRGLGQKADYYTAARLFEAGVKRRDADCMNNLAVMYEYGLGVPRNAQAAATLYRRAAEIGNREASSNLQRFSFKENAKASQSQSTPPAERVLNAALRLVDALPLPEPWPTRLKAALTRTPAKP